MNRMKRRRKPQAKAAPRSKAQKRAALMPATGIDAFAAFRQYYGSHRRGKSFVMLQHTRDMQMQGRAVRGVISQGGEMKLIDYAELERRALMHVDLNSMRDYHLVKASEKFGIDISEVTPEQRAIAKAENFFDLYSGKWPPAIANQKEPGDAE